MRRHRGGLPAHLALQHPAPRDHAEDQQQQQAESDQKVARIDRRGTGDDCNIVVGAQQNFEGHLGGERVGAFQDADAGHPDFGARRNRLGGWSRTIRMAVNGGENFAVGSQHQFILRSLPHLGDNLAFNRNQIVMMAGRVVAFRRKCLPGCRQRRDRRGRMVVPDFAVRQIDKAVVDFGKAGCVRRIADPQGACGQGIDPNALGAVLQDNG